MAQGYVGLQVVVFGCAGVRVQGSRKIVIRAAQGRCLGLTLLDCIWAS